MVVDHLKCYKVKDPNKLSGVVDLTSPQFGLEPGCKISKTRKFCVPVKKAVTSAFLNGAQITPAPVSGQNLIDDYVCYKILCKTPPPTSAKVEDQFSTRTFTKFKAMEVCVPAHKVP
jgi:hypothetical protein